MDYIYGNLNKLVDLQKYKFVSSDGTILTSVDNENNVNIVANTQQLVTLKQISNSTDNIKHYRLFAYNNESKDFDIPLGEEIVVGEPSPGGNTPQIPTIEAAWVKIGEYQKMEPILDSDGNPTFDPETGIQMMKPVYDEDGNPVMVPIYHKVDIDIDSTTGNLIFNKIPASAIVDQLEDGTYIESVIDGNAGGKIY